MKKIIKIKGSDRVVVTADTVDIKTPAPESIAIEGTNAYKVDRWGNKHLMIGGCNAGFDVVDFDGDIPDDINDGYELVDGKLKKVKP